MQSSDNFEEASRFPYSVDSDVVEVDDFEEDGQNDEGEQEDNREEKYIFVGEMNPMDFAEDNEFGFQPCPQFERIEYGPMSDRKRKACGSSEADGIVKRARAEDALTSIDEAMENMSFGMPRKLRPPKKRGRRKGSKNHLSPELSRKLGEATIYYAKGEYKDAIHVLREVVKAAPKLSESYYKLGLVYEEIGDKKKAMNFYMIAVELAPKDHSFLWKRLFALSIDQGKADQAAHFLDKAIKADPEDTELRFNRAELYVEVGEYHKAAELYRQILELQPDNVEAHIMAAKIYHMCNQVEQSIKILEDYIQNHSIEADMRVTNLLVSIHMKNNEHAKAIQQIEHARLTSFSQKQLPISLTVKAGICQIHLGNIKEAEVLLSLLQAEYTVELADFIREVAETCRTCGQYELALKYNFMLEGNCTHESGHLHLRIAKCYLSLMERAKAIKFFYKALCRMEDNIDLRVTLASLLLEEGKEDEVITLLSPPENVEPTIEESRAWWDSGEVKRKLAQAYLAKGMVGDFVDLIFPLIFQTLSVEYLNQKFKPRQKLPNSTLSERMKVLENRQDDCILHGFRPLAATSELLKAARARRSLQKREALKEKKREAELAAGREWHSDDSDGETPKTLTEPPLPNLLKDNEHHQLILDLCQALASFGRYCEALKIIRDTQKLASNALSLEKKEELKSLETQIAHKTTTSSTSAHAEARDTVQKQPKSLAAWNHYYKIRMETKLGKRSRFLNLMMRTNPDCIPPLIILGHQFTLINQHQEAARKYLEAYKLQPHSPLINLCVGTSLINVALGLRLRNKHQCLAQGFAFLHNNLHLCENSQEALYNIARAYQHVGLVTLAVTYYEKVLATHENDCCVKDQGLAKVQQPGYCNLHAETAYNLHLIYKTSGALGLARQVLRYHCHP